MYTRHSVHVHQTWCVCILCIHTYRYTGADLMVRSRSGIHLAVSDTQGVPLSVSRWRGEHTLNASEVAMKGNLLAWEPLLVRRCIAPVVASCPDWVLAPARCSTPQGSPSVEGDAPSVTKPKPRDTSPSLVAGAHLGAESVLRSCDATMSSDTGESFA